MKGTNLISTAEFYDYPTQSEINGRWVHGRPIGWSSLKVKLKLAWGVFTGKYDALKWEENQ